MTDAPFSCMLWRYRLTREGAMRFTDVDERTAATFLHCLHDEREDDPRVMQRRKRWFDEHRDKGFRAKVLVLDSGEVPAMAQYIPIEHSPFGGRDLLAILCMWVHGYDHHLGNRQGQGYGRVMLEAIEKDARASGAKGVVAWGMDFEYWNPVSFYEHMGYERVEKDGMSVMVWKPFVDDAEPPWGFKPARRPVIETDKVTLEVNAAGGGVLTILVPAGGTVRIGEVVGRIADRKKDAAPETADTVADVAPAGIEASSSTAT